MSRCKDPIEEWEFRMKTKMSWDDPEIREARLNGMKSTQFKKGCISLNKGKYASETTREKQRQKKLGKPSPMKGKRHTEEANRKNREKHLKLWQDPDYVTKQLEVRGTEEHRIKISESNRGKYHPPHTEEWKKKNSEMFLNKWKDAEWKEKHIKAIARGNHIKPNLPEGKLWNIINEVCPNEYKLNILGDTVINGKIPDNINCNGQKKCINLNGLYWHLWRLQKKEPNLTKEVVKERERKPYEELGYNLLIIWEDELKNVNKVKEKIHRFNRANIG